MIKTQVSGRAKTDNSAIVWINGDFGNYTFSQMMSPATKDGGFVSGCMTTPAILSQNDTLKVTVSYPSLKLNNGFGNTGSSITVFVLYA